MATRKSTTKRKTAAKRARGGAKKSTAKRASTRARSGAAAGGAGGGGALRTTRAPAIPATPARQARAIQRTARQSPYKMRLVIDEIRGKDVNAALNYLAFSKKHAAKQIEKVLRSAVANAENHARADNESLDVDTLFVKHAVVNEGPKLKRFTPAAMGRATPIQKRTSHVEIVVAARQGAAR
ncbi:MAG: 50S ribosomal protein L22 [Gemmatimonadetes bacterium]|nr:MAG: 50S ribosomal protein L22 [Gemmatimonadota bacterium]